MKAKNNNPSTPIIPIAKNSNWLDGLSEQSFIHHPSKSEWRERLIFTLFEWLDKSEGIMIEAFLYEYKIPRMTIDAWCNKHADLKSAFTQAKIFMGARRRKGAIHNKFNYAAAFRDMHCYDSSWHQNVDQYHAKLKADADQQAHGNKEYIYEKVIEYREKPKDV
jgi:hypothetical protein